MKTIDISPLKILVNEFDKPIRSKLDLIILTLKVFEFILIQNKISRFPNDFVNDCSIKLIISKMNRIFFWSEYKAFSFTSPFTITIENTNMSIIEPRNNIIISNKIISELLSLIENFKENKHDDVFTFIDENDDAMIFWAIFREMITNCSGYVRYDVDEENVNGDLHPLHHLDVNYTNSSTFKVGLKSKLSIDTFVDILNIESNCFYLIQ